MNNSMPALNNFPNRGNVLSTSLQNLAPLPEEAKSNKAAANLQATGGRGLPGLIDQNRVDKIARDVFVAVNAADDGEDAEQVSMPALRKATEEGRLTRDARLVQLLAQFNINSSESQSTTLQNALASMLSQAEGRKQRLTALGANFDRLTAELKQAQAALDSGIGDVVTSQAVYDRAVAELHDSQEALQRLKDSGISESDPAFIAAKNRLNAATNLMGQAREQLAGATSRLDALHASAQALVDKHGAALDEMWDATRNSTGQTLMGRNTLTEANEKSMSALARMVLLISSMIETISEGNASKLKSDLAINETRMEAVRKRNLKLAAEHEEQLRKAEKAAKTGNCITKILGGLAAIVGVVATVLTGGIASGIGMGLTAVGIGLMVADTIAEAATGKTLTGYIFNPLMEHIFKPMMNAIGQIVSEVFDKTPLGLLLNAIDKATGANMMHYVHQAVTALVVVTAIVAAAMLLRSGAKIVIDKLAETIVPVVIEAIKKAVSNVVAQLPKVIQAGLSAGNKMALGLAQSVDELLASAAKKINLSPGNRMEVAKYANLASDGVQLTQAVSSATHNVISAEFHKQSQITLASFMVSQHLLDVLTKTVGELLDVLKRNDEYVQNETRRLSEIQNQSMNTSALIIKKMKV